MVPEISLVASDTLGTGEGFGGVTRVFARRTLVNKDNLLLRSTPRKRRTRRLSNPTRENTHVSVMGLRGSYGNSRRLSTSDRRATVSRGWTPSASGRFFN